MNHTNPTTGKQVSAIIVCICVNKFVPANTRIGGTEIKDSCGTEGLTEHIQCAYKTIIFIIPVYFSLPMYQLEILTLHFKRFTDLNTYCKIHESVELKQKIKPERCSYIRKFWESQYLMNRKMTLPVHTDCSVMQLGPDEYKEIIKHLRKDRYKFLKVLDNEWPKELI